MISTSNSSEPGSASTSHNAQELLMLAPSRGSFGPESRQDEGRPAQDSSQDYSQDARL
ncbi:hypothetical protein [Leptolyngbya sp. FACHB-261]|uniref:hypothetical protein n=1 Tax=Leptolyngbya sp. FACHB-261 TaxID=2692806 RepID=UPI001685005C|nr:hypothetical protein [Leptolyngbya sp. FACHB-261]